MDETHETGPVPSSQIAVGGSVSGSGNVVGNGNTINTTIVQPATPEQPYELQTPPARGELPEPGTLPPGSRIHSERNKNFTGREADLLALADALVYAPQPGTLTVTQTIAGLGGIGKSQLAVEFCYRYGRFFRGVHWLDARQSLEVEIAACGAKMNLPNWPQTTPEQLRCTLNAWQRAPRRLLVLDNLEEPEILRKWKPELEGMSLLVTSRNPTWDTDLAAVRRLDVLARAESLLLLRRLAPRLKTVPDNELDSLAERLGDLPLALDLAGRYLKDRPLAPQQYLEKLHETALKHPSLKAPKAGSPTRHDTDVELTFLLSWEQLQDNPCDTLAKRFFIAAGYLAPNVPIPRDIFYLLTVPDDWQEKQIPDSQWEQLTENAHEALLRLLSIGLLTETFSIHPLLAEFARAREVDNVILVVLADKMSRLSKQMVETGLPIKFAPLRSHLEILTLAAEQAELAVSGALWNNLGCYLQFIAEYSAALSACEHAFAVSEKEFGSEHPNVAAALNNLGETLRLMGDLQGAKNKFEHALKILEKQFGTEHPNVAIALSGLGLVLQTMGDLAGAKALLERTLAIWEKQIGIEHSQVASALNNLGVVLQSMGDLANAKVYCERALVIWEKQLGPEHPQVATVINNLGEILRALGDLQRAKLYFECTLVIWEKQLGPEHPQIAFAANNLGLVLQTLGDLPNAKIQLERALVIWEKQFGAAHLNVAFSVNNLGMVLQGLGDFASAKVHYQRALTILEKQLGPEHPNVAFIINNLGMVAQALGDLPGAKNYFEHALTIWKKQRNVEYPEEALALNNLGTVLQAMGDRLNAKAYYECALEIDEKVYGKEHPDVARDLHNLATLLAEMGDLRHSLALEEHALMLWQKFLPPEHPNIETAHKILAEIERRMEMQKAE